VFYLAAFGFLGSTHVQTLNVSLTLTVATDRLHVLTRQVKGEDKIMAPEEVSSMVLTKMKETPPRKIRDEAVIGVDPKWPKTRNHAIDHPNFT
jgi:molecular chaperone DnaK (HSP70)